MLLAAHVLGDFVLQTARDVQRKREPLVLTKHALIHAALAMLLIADYTTYYIPLAVFVTHAILDYAKARWYADSAAAFLADQAGHILVMAVLARVFAAPEPLAFGWGEQLHLGTAYAKLAALLAGFIVTVRAGKFVLALFIKPYLDELRDRAPESGPSALQNAGQTIGVLERLLIFVLVMADQVGAVGFLIAAKSVFRFGELKESTKRMESEYIIIGTLASFAYGICASLATRALWCAL
ncbi:MAG: DUF3307 domain-containing protein [Planctomycetota bacterium]